MNSTAFATTKLEKCEGRPRAGPHIFSLHPNSRHGSSADYLLRHELGAVLLEKVLVGHEREVVRDDAGRRRLVAVGERKLAQEVPPHSALPVVKNLRTVT